MGLIDFTLSDSQFRQLLNEHKQDRETERQRHAAVIARLDTQNAKLDRLLQSQEELKNQMANLEQQVTELKTAVNELGVAIAAENAEALAALEVLKNGHPELTAEIDNIKAHTEAVKKLIEQAPIVPDVTPTPTERRGR